MSRIASKWFLFRCPPLKVSPQKEKKQAPSSSSSSSASHSKEELSLSEDQQRAVDFVLDGKSVFFTGERERERNGGRNERDMREEG